MAGANDGEAGSEGTDGAVAAAARLFAGPGEMRARCRAHDWAATPLGPVEGWAPALCAAVRLALETPLATCLWCGPEYVLLYNDAYRPALGARHPAALGRPGAAVRDEAWAQLGPRIDEICAGGEPRAFEDRHFVLKRHGDGGVEDAWFTYAFAALRDEAGTIIAVYNQLGRLRSACAPTVSGSDCWRPSAWRGPTPRRRTTTRAGSLPEYRAKCAYR